MKSRIRSTLSKVKVPGKKPAVPDSLDGRITNETVAEHRERILAGGRRFKYPVQYSRYKLVINSVIIGVISLVVAGFLFWWQLYPVQNSSKFIYRMTQIFPVPVAQVDGENVPYSTYLKRFRSSIHYLQQQNGLNVNIKDGKKEVEYRKRVELDNAVRDAFATKLARDNHISVTNNEVDSFITNDLRSKKVSEAAYERNVLNAYYDWSMSDYRSIVHAELLKRKVSIAIDTAARSKADRVLAELRKPNADFGAIAKTESDDPTKANGGDMGDVSVKTLDTNGVLETVGKMKAGQMTGLIYGVDGYYIAKLTSKTETTVRYQVIKVALTEFDKRLAQVKEDGKVKEYISVKKLEA